MSSLTPQHVATLMQKLCETVPTWEYGALGSSCAMQVIAPALQRPETAEQGARLALFAWQDDPLDVRLARVVAALTPSPLHTHLTRWCSIPENSSEIFESVAHAAQAQNLPALMQRFLPHPEHGGFWLRQAFGWCLRHDLHGETCAQMLEQVRLLPQEGMPALANRLYAQWAWGHLAAEKALPLCKANMPGFSLWQSLRVAHCLHRLQQTTEALELMRQVWRSCPCHPNMVLALHEMAFPAPPAPSLSSTQACLPPLALYSWNKADILAATLESLLRTEAAAAPVLVLDNGCSDETSTMLTHMAERWPTAERGGRGSLRILTLPVNVGAPAARNWLLTQPEVVQGNQILFLDDDLELEQGWLSGLVAAAAAHPKASVLGCRVVDHVPPHATQAADFFLLPPELGDRSFLDMQENIFLHGPSMGSTDNQLSAHTRPCLSVSGCCHWLRWHKDASPLLFDVRFNPSQFDDLERDLRVHMAGGEVLCVGSVRVKHVQHSSLRQAQSRSRSAHIFGNKIKLEHLYTEAQVLTLRERSALAARHDLLRKITRLAAGEKV